MTRTVSNLVADLQNAHELYNRMIDYLDKEQNALAGTTAQWEGLEKQYTHEYLLSAGASQILPTAYSAANTYRGFRDTKREVATTAIAILRDISRLTTPRTLSSEAREITWESEQSLEAIDRQTNARSRIAKCIDAMVTGIQTRLNTFEATTRTAASHLDRALRSVRNTYGLPSPGYSNMVELSATKWGLDRTIADFASIPDKSPSSQVDFASLNSAYKDKVAAAHALNHMDSTDEVAKLGAEKAAEKLEKLATLFESASQGSVVASAIPAPVKASDVEIPAAPAIVSNANIAEEEQALNKITASVVAEVLSDADDDVELPVSFSTTLPIPAAPAAGIAAPRPTKPPLLSYAKVAKGGGKKEAVA